MFVKVILHVQIAYLNFYCFKEEKREEKMGSSSFFSSFSSTLNRILQ